MKLKMLAIAVPMIVAGCHSGDHANNPENVNENFTSADMTDMNAADMNATDLNLTTYSNAATTSMNASAPDNDVLAPPPPQGKKHPK
jgi:hypothetical protein